MNFTWTGFHSQSSEVTLCSSSWTCVCLLCDASVIKTNWISSFVPFPPAALLDDQSVCGRGERLALALARENINSQMVGSSQARVEVDVYELQKDSQYDTTDTSKICHSAFVRVYIVISPQNINVVLYLTTCYIMILYIINVFLTFFFFFPDKSRGSFIPLIKHPMNRLRFLYYTMSRTCCERSKRHEDRWIITVSRSWTLAEHKVTVTSAPQRSERAAAADVWLRSASDMRTGLRISFKSTHIELQERNTMSRGKTCWLNFKEIIVM